MNNELIAKNLPAAGGCTPAEVAAVAGHKLSAQRLRVVHVMWLNAWKVEAGRMTFAQLKKAAKAYAYGR